MKKTKNGSVLLKIVACPVYKEYTKGRTFVLRPSLNCFVCLFFFFLNGVLMLKCILFSLMLEVPFTFSETQVSILLNFFVTQLGFKDFEIACIKAFGVLR